MKIETKTKTSQSNGAYPCTISLNVLSDSILYIKWQARCQFHQRKTHEFFERTSFLYVRVARKKAAETTFVQKIRT